jgi:hypothetical protein
MDDGKSKGETTVGPGEVKVLKLVIEGHQTFHGRCAIGWIVAKTADRTFRECLGIDKFEADRMAVLNPLPNLAAGVAEACNIEPRGWTGIVRAPAPVRQDHAFAVLIRLILLLPLRPSLRWRQLSCKRSTWIPGSCMPFVLRGLQFSPASNSPGKPVPHGFGQITKDAHLRASFVF